MSVKSSGCGLAVKEAPDLDLRASRIWPAGKRETVPTGCSRAKVRLPAQALGLGWDWNPGVTADLYANLMALFES